MTPKFSQAVDPVFLHILALLERFERSESPSPEEEQLRIRALIDQAEAKLGTEKDWNHAKYGLVAWIDEMLVDARWEGRSWWSNNILEMQYFNSRKAFEEFFIHAQDASALTSKDALEVYYVCVILGFRGLYRDPDSGPALAMSLNFPANLDEWCRKTALSIRLGQGREPPGAPGPEKIGAPPLRAASSVVWPWLVAVALTITGVLYAYYGLDL